MSSYGEWKQESDRWRYEADQDYVISDWRLINNTWYYFDNSGYMVTGWQKIFGKWYFLNPASEDQKERC